MFNINILIKIGLTTLADILFTSANQEFLKKLIDGSIVCPDLLIELNFKLPPYIQIYTT